MVPKWLLNFFVENASMAGWRGIHLYKEVLGSPNEFRIVCRKLEQTNPILNSWSEVLGHFVEYQMNGISASPSADFVDTSNMGTIQDCTLKTKWRWTKPSQTCYTLIHVACTDHYEASRYSGTTHTWVCKQQNGLNASSWKKKQPQQLWWMTDGNPHLDINKLREREIVSSRMQKFRYVWNTDLSRESIIIAVAYM